MPISPHLLRKLQEALGAEAADDLVRLMDGMDANRGDIRELRHEMQLGFARIEARFDHLEEMWAERFENSEARWTERSASSDTKWTARFESLEIAWAERFDKGQARMEAMFEKGLREQTRFFFLAWGVLLAAIIGIYAR